METLVGQRLLRDPAAQAQARACRAAVLMKQQKPVNSRSFVLGQNIMETTLRLRHRRVPAA